MISTRWNMAAGPIFMVVGTYGASVLIEDVSEFSVSTNRLHK